MSGNAIVYDYYNERVKNVVNRITEELEFYRLSPLKGVFFVSEYIEYLENRLGQRKKTYHIADNSRDIKKLNPEEYALEMVKFSFQRPWKKLDIYHKKVKIGEYVDSLDPKPSPKMGEYLKKQICDGLINKKFLKNKDVIEYNPEEMVIDFISCIHYDEKKEKYSIVWKKQKQ